MLSALAMNKVYKSNNYGNFKILKFVSKAKHSANDIYEIEFMDTNSKRLAKLSNILKGEVQDYAVEKRTRYQGINMESSESLRDGSRNIYDNWLNILRRCNEEYAYRNVRISNEWLNYTNFKSFVLDPINGYRVDYKLDKDLLSNPKDRVYSSETCVFIPPLLNGMLADHSREKWSPNPPGVHIYHKDKSRIKMVMSYKGKFVVSRYFDKDQKLIAFCYYKLAKEYILKLKAIDLYKSGDLCEKAYNGIMGYKLYDTRTNHYSDEDISKVIETISQAEINKLYNEINIKYIEIESHS